METSALKSAVELDVFTAIGEGKAEAAGIARRVNASEKGTRALCDFLTAHGFLTKSGGKYGLTPESAAYLDRRSPFYMGSAVEFLNSPMMYEAFGGLTSAIRKGATALSEHTMAPEHPIWEKFARAMAPVMAGPAELLARLLRAQEAGPWKVLDLAAGHGLFGITLARHNRQAEVAAVDWAGVLRVAQENAEAAGVADRYRTIAGSAFDVEFGSGYDLVLLTNFLHHFDPSTCERLLRKVRTALKPEGRAVTLEFVPNPDRVTPPVPASFSLIMLATTEQGDAYTFAEYERMFRNAGFAASELHHIPPSFSDVIVSRR